jgi:hypothetical protein
VSLPFLLDRRGFRFGHGHRADAAALVRRMAGRNRLPGALRRAGTPARKSWELGNTGVHGHSVEYSVTAWHGLPGLPDGILNKGRISRGDVLDIGEQVRAGKLSPVVLLATSFAWGTGMTGYGPRRYRDIIDAAGRRADRPDHDDWLPGFHGSR